MLTAKGARAARAECKYVALRPLRSLRFKALASAVPEHAQGHVERDAPVPRVHDLADAQIAGLAAKDIGILGAEPLLAAQPDDHIAHRVLRVLHQIGADRGGDEVALRVVLRLDRPGRGVELVAPRAQAATLHDVEAQAKL